MNYFSDERAAELRELFFESSEDLLQELNDAGILLESHPADSSALARVRRAMHTLKGDSAACGFRHLSELAHEMEDLLTAELVAQRGAAVAEIVLSAADTIHALLGAYRGNLQPPDISELREHVRKLAEKPGAAESAGESQSRAQWTAEENALIVDAIRRGDAVYHLVLRVDQSLQMPGAALQLGTKAIEQCGVVLAQRPAPGAQLKALAHLEAVVASDRLADWIQKTCLVPGIVSDVTVQRLDEAASAPRDAFQVLLEAEARSGTAVPEIEDSANADADSSRAAGAERFGGNLGSADAWLRVESGRIDAVMNLLGELIIGKSMLHRAITEFEARFPKDALRNRFGDAVSFQSRVLNELQKSVMKIRMVPVEQLFRRLPRIARDVAKLRKKEIALEMAGQHTDLDKSVLDALAEPLAHIVRNAADHGIETPNERISLGKPVRGVIRLESYHQGNQVVIEISDDGRGIDRGRLLRKAIEAGAVSEDAASRLSDSEILQLVFTPGLSTAEEVSEVSGRGIGMDVVRNVVEKLKGKVLVESQPGRGTTFQIMMPLTLASIQALMFRTGQQLYAVPLDAVLEISRITESEIHELDGHEVLRLRDQILSVVRMNNISGQISFSQKGRHFVIVIGTGTRKFGLVVDSLVGEEELVIKAFEDRLVSSELVSGASILGNGTVVLILNISAVLAHVGKQRALAVPA